MLVLALFSPALLAGPFPTNDDTPQPTMSPLAVR
jgi:hypothetical protein